jgi:flagellar protein FliO/FliZ
MFLTVIKMIVGLIIVIYLINIFLKYLNRYSLKTNKAFRILQKIPVSKSSSIGVIQILDHVYVMSFSESQNQILFELSPQEAKKFLAVLKQQTFPEKEESKQSFQAVLAKIKREWQNRQDK